jgi:hypothetical protein
MFLSSECSSGQNVHEYQNVQNLKSGSEISCVRFCVDFLQKYFYNLKHLMLGYKKLHLRFNHHVKP